MSQQICFMLLCCYGYTDITIFVLSTFNIKSKN